MVKTFAQLKKDLRLGRKVKLIYAMLSNHKYLNSVREVTKVQTNGIRIGESYLDWPPASLIEYVDNTLARGI